jgi:hypothetical protein
MRVRRSRAVRAALTVGAVGAFALALGSPAAAGGGEGPSTAAPLAVVKTIAPTAPAGTTFTATVACDGDIIDNGAGVGVSSATVTFGADGQPTSADTLFFRNEGQCTVTETATGGAASTTYACEGANPDEPTKESEFSASQVEPIDVVCETTGPGPITVNIIDEDQEAVVTIHNTFTDPAPQPAAQVVAQPAFTG